MSRLSVQVGGALFLSEPRMAGGVEIFVIINGTFVFIEMEALVSYSTI